MHTYLALDSEILANADGYQVESYDRGGTKVSETLESVRAARNRDLRLWQRGQPHRRTGLPSAGTGVTSFVAHLHRIGNRNDTTCLD